MSIMKNDVDLLSRDYTSLLVKIFNSSDNITIGLEGQWGKGKSFIFDKLEKEKSNEYLLDIMLGKVIFMMSH